MVCFFLKGRIATITAAAKGSGFASGRPSSQATLPINRGTKQQWDVPLRNRTCGKSRSLLTVTRASSGDDSPGDGAPLPTGTPGYQSLIKGENYDVRLYDSHYVIRTEYDRRDEGFDALGGYMDGRNEAEARLPAPQPVIMTYFPDGKKTMQLFVPTPKAGGTPPLPTVPGVSLEVAGGAAMAVIPFTGYATKEAADAAKQALIDGLRKDGMAVADEDGEFLIAQFGPLFSLSTRVNELMMPFKI